MGYYCERCDKTIKFTSKDSHIISLTHKKYEKNIQIDHTTKNPNFFDIDKISNDFITNHNM